MPCEEHVKLPSNRNQTQVPSLKSTLKNRLAHAHSVVLHRHLSYTSLLIPGFNSCMVSQRTCFSPSCQCHDTGSASSLATLSLFFPPKIAPIHYSTDLSHAAGQSAPDTTNISVAKLNCQDPESVTMAFPWNLHDTLLLKGWGRSTRESLLMGTIFRDWKMQVNNSVVLTLFSRRMKFSENLHQYFEFISIFEKKSVHLVQIKIQFIIDYLIC